MSLNISPKDSAVIKEMDAGVGRALTPEPWEQCLPWGTLLWHKVHPFQLCLLTVFEIISEQVLRMFTNSFFSQSGGSLCHGKICAHGPWVGPAFTYLCWNTGWGRYPGVSESFVASMRSVCVCVCVCVCLLGTHQYSGGKLHNLILACTSSPALCAYTHTQTHMHTQTQIHMGAHRHTHIQTNAHV